MKKPALFLLALIVYSLSFSQDIIKERLGNQINTEYDETKPLISPDGKILYFARQNYPGNNKGEKDAQDIYFSLNENGQWTEAKNIGEPLNDKQPNGVSSVSPNGNSLLVINAYHGTGLTMGGASISKKENNNWTKPQMINIENFYNFSDYVDYYLSNDEKSLLMTVEREDSEGSQDIYVSFRIDEYHWTEPITLGPIVNTPKPEFAPFLAGDNKTLFFASEGHDTKGGSDIFYSKRLDNTWQNWTTPQNIGPEVNSSGFEGYYTIPASSDFAYFVSDNESSGESKDLFKVTLPYKFRPEPVLLVKGKVISGEEKTPLAASIIFLDIEKNEEAGFALSNFDDGSYKIILPEGSVYGVLAERPGYIGVIQYNDLRTISEYQELETDLHLIPIEKGETIETHSIYFKDSTNIFKEEAYVELNRFADILNNNPELKVEIGGHAYEFSSATANLKLSEQRAEAVKKYLDDKGVNPLRVLTLGNGSVQPYEGPDVNVMPGIDLNDRISFHIIQTDWFPPQLNDQDEDGVIDEEDQCPEESGTVENKGCPEASDQKNEK